MAEKTSILNVYVDLDCRRCYRQIRKVLCKLQATADQERIRTISYNDKGQMITISGPFDPLQLCCKIRCMGGKVIKDIQIKQPQPPPPPPPPTSTCNKDIEELKMRTDYLLRICVGNNNDIERLKQQVDHLLEQERSCADLKRAIDQLEVKMAELQRLSSQKRTEDQSKQIIPSLGGCSGGCSTTVPCYPGCRGDMMLRGYSRCHGHCGSPYCGICRCYESCQLREEDTSAACSLM
ncbi:hypothetical protein E2562_004872 [Oryza meyeriana var. granulata]|uniref:HMA domain-containing protein n=1 Tax=Oryza meyeriana var. granulata TaxID=110450 RepID=A0A6G1C3X1_9ORYZ|nr:hypothetical protein E2562_004872 [Oryza meyeriana var. granulata]